MLHRLSDWLARRPPRPGPAGVDGVGQAGSGYSAENLVIGARWDDGSEDKLVLGATPRTARSIRRSPLI